MTLHDEVLTGPNAQDLAPFITDCNPRAIAELLNARTDRGIGKIPILDVAEMLNVFGLLNPMLDAADAGDTKAKSLKTKLERAALMGFKNIDFALPESVAMLDAMIELGAPPAVKTAILLQATQPRNLTAEEVFAAVFNDDGTVK